MLGKIIKLFTVIVIMLSLAACSATNDASCTDESQCVDGEGCMWIREEGRITGKACAFRCATDKECPAGMTCTGGASTCTSCNDFIRVCK